MEQIDAFIKTAQLVCGGNLGAAEQYLQQEMPFEMFKNASRQYSTAAKLALYFRDGFIDRYSGEKLLNPGYLRALSRLFPDTFPFHPNWKMSECHMAFWKYTPTVDHLVPVARGGVDDERNWVTTNMLHNAAKSNWRLEELGWRLYQPGDWREWCGLSEEFVRMVEKNPALEGDAYIKQWYGATRKMLNAK